MTALIWNEDGKRLYEAGIDRGVLYVGTDPGVAWPGLVSVEEKPTGGEPTPYYADGFKYLNITSAEEFEATISAFSAPREFGVCEGQVSLHTGLFVTQQKRKQFGFSYRTLIGNDLQGLDYGYKLHLVYNALAQPAERTNATITNTPELEAIAWDISTTPIAPAGYRPTAHVTVNSTKVDALVLGYLEGVLYGGEGLTPRLPDADDVLAIMSMLDTNYSFAVIFKGYTDASILSTPGSVGDAWVVDGTIWVYNDEAVWTDSGPDPLL